MLALVKNEAGGIRLSQLTRHSDIALLRRPVEEPRGRSSDAARVDISPEARRLHSIGILAQHDDALRAQKVSRIKEQIVQGTYHVDSVEVARAVMRNEITRLLGGE